VELRTARPALTPAAQPSGVRSSECDVLVTGAGVSGLTTAICLAEQGLRVVVQAHRPPQQTTSSVAGAIWGRHLVEAGGRAAGWARETLAVLRELAGDPAAGVRIATGVEAVRAVTHHPRGDGGTAPDEPPAPPAKLADLDEFRTCEAAGLPPGFCHGWRYSAPLAHMPTYLGYLTARFERAGGRLTVGAVTSLTGAARAAGARAVVNCTGTGARDLVPDPDLIPVRGQVVVAANPALTEFFIGHANEAAELVYLFPHGDTVVMGGTEDAGNWSTSPDPATAERIVRDCAAVEPRLRDARVLAHRVGLRPVRSAVRLEIAEPGEPVLVHNYGHGGAGITLSWGCAREAAGLVAARLG
jgi:D-amino-acid oxidase